MVIPASVTNAITPGRNTVAWWSWWLSPAVPRVVLATITLDGQVLVAEVMEALNQASFSAFLASPWTRWPRSRPACGPSGSWLDVMVAVDVMVGADVTASMDVTGEHGCCRRDPTARRGDQGDVHPASQAG